MKTGKVGLVSFSIYGGISLFAAGIFFVATTASGFNWVARIGGAAWILLLSMIVLMPIVIPMTKKRLGLKTASQEGGSDMGLFSRKAKEEKPKEMPGKSSGSTAIDPVCGMTVETSKAAATSVYQGKTYYFCAPGCKKSFDQDPAKYLTGKSGMKGM